MAKGRRCSTDGCGGSRNGKSRKRSDRQEALESWMRLKNSCPVWGGGVGKVPQHGNSPALYSTLRTVLWAAGGEIPPADPAAWNPIKARAIEPATPSGLARRGPSEQGRIPPPHTPLPRGPAGGGNP